MKITRIQEQTKEENVIYTTKDSIDYFLGGLDYNWGYKCVMRMIGNVDMKFQVIVINFVFVIEIYDPQWSLAK